MKTTDRHQFLRQTGALVAGTAALCHLGNIATRVGCTLPFNPKTEQIEGDEEVNHLVRRAYRDGHGAVPKGV